ncbi:TetR/AcrR family transcriptional regulator [Nocardioides marmorisolisilvae]|uniref:TetR/AcrR family transcriptional regulator n=1 Tax=Nocardioides marmorisolisilvae TaxID=1542737 RepID=A0A3N0DVJ4_9ACTN|nr:TetR/AcrR family transcriptional regulator [Nocardioides marmorisolisilvae]RNL79637.1 TetR/AcrR family transcriptional regulator [Nocardioides marmorisolisilvae]
MRTHGWGGRPPSDDAEARDRIIVAAKAVLDRYGPEKTTLADVASDLGVTRQTVYRYFKNTEDLLRAAALSSAAEFLDRLVAHVDDLDDPADILAEAMVWTLDRLPKERYLGVLLAVGHDDAMVRGITSEPARTLGGAILDRFPIDWSALGIDDSDRAELAEVMLRLLVSFVRDPGDPARSGPDLRAFLRRWVGAMLVTGARTGA